MSKVNVTIRMDKDLKKQADEVFEELGMSFTTAVTLFTKQCVRDRELPFEPRLEPNKTTIKALKELNRMIKHPEEYKGHVGHVSTVIRIALMGRAQSPDVWAIQQIMGEEMVRARLNAALQ